MIDNWKSSKRPGLASPTFLAWSQTLRAVADISVHLLDHHDFKYILTSKLQSDPIEGRFGLYRQLNGASYFVSVRQIMLAEKKIRVRNIMPDVFGKGNNFFK